jgi:hypothetical protein
MHLTKIIKVSNPSETLFDSHTFWYQCYSSLTFQKATDSIRGWVTGMIECNSESAFHESAFYHFLLSAKLMYEEVLVRFPYMDIAYRITASQCPISGSVYILIPDKIKTSVNTVHYIYP